MLVDPVAGPPSDLAHDRTETGVVDIPTPAAVGADDMMVMDGVAGDVRVVAAGQVDALDRPKLRQDVEGSEDRGASDAPALARRVVDEVCRREVALPTGDQVDDRTPGGGRAVAGPAQGRIDGGRVRVHFRDDTQYQYDLSSRTAGGARYPYAHGTFVRL